VFNGFFVVGLGIDPFIVTLGSASVFVAISEMISGNQVVATGIPNSFLALARDKLLGIPLPVIYAIVLAAVLWYVFDMTPAGRMLYATGGGRDAARLSGIPTRRILYICFICSALGASIAGCVFASQLGSGQPDVGGEYLLPVYAAAVLGSTMIRPGRFNVPGLIIAMFILAFGINGLELANAPAWIVDGFPGAALIVAVVLSKELGRARGSGGVAL
jgi:ribose transport system permease protein